MCINSGYTRVYVDKNYIFYLTLVKKIFKILTHLDFSAIFKLIH